MTVIVLCGFDLSKTTDEERRAATRTLVCAAALIVAFTVLFVLPPLFVFQEALGLHAALLLVPQAVPLALPIGLAFSITLMTSTRVRKGTARLILLVAMLRAQGVPARLATGLREESGRFYPSGWVEFFDRDWIPVDPENGMVPADASRLRLLIEHPARPLDLMLLAGRTEVTVLDTATVQP